MASSPAPRVRTCLCHRLLRARDWQDRPQLEAVCQWCRGGGPGVCGLVGIGGAGNKTTLGLVVADDQRGRWTLIVKADGHRAGAKNCMAFLEGVELTH
jgi:signal recognition particle GTPase